MSSIFIGSLLFSIWSVVLFWGKDLGLSVFLFVVPITYFFISVLEKNKKVNYKGAKILIIPIALLSSTFFIFNNKLFQTLNLIIIPALLIFMIIQLIEKDLRLDAILARTIEILFNPISYLGLTMEKLKELLKMKFNIKREKKSNEGIGKALLITIPIVIFIIFLLSSADEEFANIFTNIIKLFSRVTTKLNVSDIIFKVIFIVISFVYLSSFLDNIVTRYEEEKNGVDNNEEKVAENTTIKMILVTLNLIYILTYEIDSDQIDKEIGKTIRDNLLIRI